MESNFENDINELIYKTETDFKNKLLVMKRELSGEGKNLDLELTHTHYYL